MPSAQLPPERDPFHADRFIPAIHRVQTPNYHKCAEDIEADFLRRLAGSQFLTIKYGLIDAGAELGRIARLKPNWNSYGADAPSAEAIRISNETISELSASLLLPSFIVPSAEGGVSIYFVNRNKTAYIEIGNAGSQVLVMYDDAGATDVFEVGQELAVEAVGGTILDFLG